MGLSFRFGPRALAVLVGALAFAAAPPLAADLFVPSKTTDSFDGVCDSDCSLREAVAGANASPGPDVIVLGTGVYVLTLAGPDEDKAATGDLDVTDHLDIVGADPATTIIDGAGLDRVLEVHGKRVDVQGVTVRHGAVQGDGGGVRNRFGDLTLSDVVVAGNDAGGAGGGVWSQGELTLGRVTVTGNAAGTSGGGVAARQKLTLANATLSGNRAAQGGGLHLAMPAFGRAVNLTVTTNEASVRGGGVFSEPATPGMGVAFGGSILAGNAAAADPDCAGGALSGGYNLLGVGGGCAAFSAGKNDQAGSAAEPLDARLAPLTDAGGSTPTHPLQDDSPALDAGEPPLAPDGEATFAGMGCEPVDQRGAPRPGQGSQRCDAGAFERTGACVASGSALCLGGGRFRITAASKLPQEAPHPAGTRRLTGDSGSFWFFAPGNVELTVKVLDACAFAGRYWVFLSGLTDVEFTVTVEDAGSGQTRVYTHARGTPFAPILDTDAFATCEPLPGFPS